MHTRCIVETSGFTRAVCKNSGILLNLKVSSVIPREQAILRKSKKPRKSPEKWTFLSLAFYNAPSLHIVKRMWSPTLQPSSPICVPLSAQTLPTPKKKSGGINSGTAKGGRPWRGSVKIEPGFFQVFK